MVISSIDLKGGKVVQLKNGKDLVLERDDAEDLIAGFDRFGEVAIIDLDAALGSADSKGNTANTALLKSLLRKGDVRVGGGIRSVKTARKLISLGAQKVIVGSAAWRQERAAGESALNTQFLEELCRALGKQRIIVSVDSIEGMIAVKGWTEATSIPLLEGAREAEKFAGELLFTCVEKEGCMQGTNMKLAQKLRDAVDCRVTVAGGVSSTEEVAALAKMGCDVQLGMALYTGAVKLGECFVECLNWEKTGDLIPVIVQSTAGEVLMLGFANKDALATSFATSRLTFFSRTKDRLWTKGETSGHYLNLVKVRADCDRDTVLATVTPTGSVCHTGSYSCFSSEAIAKSSMERLYEVIGERLDRPHPGSYTATLNDVRVREKILEEAEELTQANSRDDVIWEAADLLYFVSVLMRRERVSWQEIYDELDRRHKK